MKSLILFDIDATLLATGGLGVRAMGRAGQKLFGPTFTTERLDFAGRLDPLLVRELFGMNGVERTDEAERAFRVAYRSELEALFAASSGHTALRGASELVDRLVRDGRVALGVLTGNFAETGTMKLAACGLDPGVFKVSVWGDDSPHDPPARDHLPVVAMSRFHETYGRAVDPARVTIIGDTPHDVRCAKVNGCRVLGVATGRYSLDDLNRAGADRSVPDLSDTEGLAAWLLAGA